MKKTTTVAFLLLISLKAFCSPLLDTIQAIESDWAISYYQNSQEQQKADYPKLLQRARDIGKQYPNHAEPKIWQAVLLSANAAYQSPFDALDSLKRAKQLLEQAIAINPEALEGAAFVTLGTLYYMVPGWPVSFGDNQMAEQLLKKGLSINPDGIDANYFYADFLLQQDKISEAERHLHIALTAPIRPEQILADSELQKDAGQALLSTRKRKLNEGKSKFLSLFSSAKYEGR